MNRGSELWSEALRGGGYDKQDKDDYPAAYDYDYPTSIYPVATNLQKSFYQRQFYRPTNNQFRRFYISPSFSARAQARPFHVSPYNNFNQNMWRNRQNFLNRRIDMVLTEEHASEDKKSDQSNKLLNWRYLLGLPPWFLKEWLDYLPKYMCRDLDWNIFEKFSNMTKPYQK